MMDKENKLILYKDDEGRVSVNTRFADEDVWLTQEQLATIYQTTQENVSMHISNIYEDKELEKEGTYKKFLLVRQEGKRQVKRNIDHYNLDERILSLLKNARNLSTEELASSLGLSKMAASRYLKQIEDSSMIESVGTVRNKRWMIKLV